MTGRRARRPVTAVTRGHLTQSQRPNATMMAARAIALFLALCAATTKFTLELDYGPRQLVELVIGGPPAPGAHAHGPWGNGRILLELVYGPPVAHARVLEAMGVCVLPSGAPVTSIVTGAYACSLGSMRSAGVLFEPIQPVHKPNVLGTGTSLVSVAHEQLSRRDGSLPAVFVQLLLGPGELSPGVTCALDDFRKIPWRWLNTTHWLQRVFASTRAERRYEARQLARQRRKARQWERANSEELEKMTWSLLLVDVILFSVAFATQPICFALLRFILNGLFWCSVAALLLPVRPPCGSSHTVHYGGITMAARAFRILLLSAMRTVAASPHSIEPTATTAPPVTAAPSSSSVVLYTFAGLSVLFMVACWFMIDSDDDAAAAVVGGGAGGVEHDLEMGSAPGAVSEHNPGALACGEYNCFETFISAQSRDAHHRNVHGRKRPRDSTDGSRATNSDSTDGSTDRSREYGGHEHSARRHHGSQHSASDSDDNDGYSSSDSASSKYSFCSLSSKASIRVFDRQSPAALAMAPDDYRQACMLQDALRKPDIFGHVYRAAYNFIRPIRYQLRLHAAASLQCLAFDRMDSMFKALICDCGTPCDCIKKKFATSRTMRKWMKTAARIIFGGSVEPVAMEFPAEIGGKTHTVRGSRLPLRPVIIQLLQNPYLTNWSRFLTGDHDRDHHICRAAYGDEMPTGPVVGEPMLTENMQGLCQRTVAKFAGLAASLHATVLPVPLLFSIDGVPPDRSLNKSFVAVQMSLFNWLQPVRATHAAWALVGNFSSFSVGKGPGMGARRDARYESLQYFLRQVLTIPLLQELRVADPDIELPLDTTELEPFIMDRVSGANGQRFLVVPLFAAATCDYVGACEVCEVNGGACHMCLVKHYYGTHYSISSDEPRPRVRDPGEIESALAALTAASVPAATQGITKAQRRDRIAAAKRTIKSLRVHSGVMPALQLLVRATWGAPHSVYSRVKATDGLHLFDLGHMKHVHQRLTGNCNLDKEKNQVLPKSSINKHSFRVSQGVVFNMVFNSGPFRLAAFPNGYSSLTSLSGVKGSEFPSLVIRDLAALGVEPGLCSEASASEDERERYHREVIGAVEAVIVARTLAHKRWYTPQDLRDFDTAIKHMLDFNNRVFVPVTSAGVERRPKAHQAGTHLVHETVVDGATINYNTNSTEGNHKLVMKAAYALTNHGIDTHGQMLSLGSLFRFIKGEFALVARVPQEDASSRVPLAPADYHKAMPLSIYRVVPPVWNARTRREVPANLLTFCRAAFSAWLKEECKYDRRKQMIPVRRADKFDAANCSVKLRARLVVYPIADCHVVADSNYKGEHTTGRHDFVEVLDGKMLDGKRNPDSNSVCRLELIVSYRFPDVDTASFKRESEVGEYVLLHKLSPKLDSPFTLLDFHRELPKDLHSSYSWLPLNSLLRPSCVLPNFDKSNRQDG